MKADGIRIVGTIQHVETIADGSGIRELAGLRARYGDGNWKKKKGVARMCLPDGTQALAEVHWYEAHGIGKVKIKVKRWL
jgi:hypothetical protein